MTLIGVGLIGVFVVGIGALLLVRATLTNAPAAVPTAPFSDGVTPLDAPRLLTDFSLPGKDGSPLALSDLRGGYTVLFFGFTQCPDFCPLTLAELRRVKALLTETVGAEAAATLQVLLVSVDGERDTPAVLRKYVDRFDPTFYAMQGDPPVLDGIAGEYGLFYELLKDDPTDSDYTVEHTTSSYIIDPQGQLIAVLSFGAEPEAIAAYLAERLA